MKEMSPDGWGWEDTTSLPLEEALLLWEVWLNLNTEGQQKKDMKSLTISAKPFDWKNACKNFLQGSMTK